MYPPIPRDGGLMSGDMDLPWMAPSSRLRITARDWLLRLASLPRADRLFMNNLSPGGHRLIT